MILKNLIEKSIIELKKAGIKTAELDATILLREAIEQDNTFIYINPKYLITNSQYSKFRRYIRKRKQGMPIAYIIGHKEFFGYDFSVNKTVLIPRPETEWLVETSLNFIKNKDQESLKILDLGTGSGCIIISIANELKKINLKVGETELFGSDISKKALTVAKKNAKNNELNNIKFYNSNLFSNRLLHKKFDLIVSNLPYVPQLPDNKIKANGIAFEPFDAIFAKDNGTAIIIDLLKKIPHHLNQNGMLILETDQSNNKIIVEKAKKILPKSYTVESSKDLANLDRYITIQADKPVS